MQGSDEVFAERHWTSREDVLASVVDLLGVPLPADFRPVGLTVVMVAANDAGLLGRYPLYANASNNIARERHELGEAIKAIERLIGQLDSR